MPVRVNEVTPHGSVTGARATEGAVERLMRRKALSSFGEDPKGQWKVRYIDESGPHTQIAADEFGARGYFDRIRAKEGVKGAALVDPGGEIVAFVGDIDTAGLPKKRTWKFYAAIAGVVLTGAWLLRR